MVLDPSPPPFWGIPLRLFNKHSTRRSKERPIYTKRDLQKRPTKETLNNPGEIPLYFFDSTLAASAPMCQNRLYTSKETCKRDLQTNPTKETCKRDLQKRPANESYKRDLTWYLRDTAAPFRAARCLRRACSPPSGCAMTHSFFEVTHAHVCHDIACLPMGPQKWLI